MSTDMVRYLGGGFNVLDVPGTRQTLCSYWTMQDLSLKRGTLWRRIMPEEDIILRRNGIEDGLEPMQLQGKDPGELEQADVTKHYGVQ